MRDLPHPNSTATLSRRDLLKALLYASPITLFNPGGLFADQPVKPLFPPRIPTGGDLLRVAQIGIAGQGRRDFRIFRNLEGTKLKYVAFADVDDQARGNLPLSTANGPQEIPEEFLDEVPMDLPFFTDYRVLLEQLHEEIDAVIISIPDHAHFAAAMHAMLLGKHVYLEKPMAHTVRECRLLEKVARETGVVTQMGNQGHSASGTLQFIEWVRQGMVREVTRVDAWMNLPRCWHGWEFQDYPSEPVPDNLDWDQWLNRTPYRPHSASLAPYNWRGWYQFGCGCFGDWGSHILDAVFVGLELDMPYEITTRLIGPSKVLYPQGSVVTFKFRERKGMPAMEINWYDGQENPPPLPPGYDGEMGNVGTFIYTADFVQQGGSHGSPYRVVPQSRWQEVAPLLTTVKPAGRDHMESFIDACRGEDTTTSRFEVSARLSELLCLGCIGQRFGGTLQYDAKAMRITNHKKANKMLHGPDPRPGWGSYYEFKRSRPGPTPGFAG